MGPLTSMITTGRLMRQKSRVLNNLIPQTRVGKLHTKIVSLNTYTHVDEMKKYRAFVKLFHTDMNKKINPYHPHIYINVSTSYENPTKYHSVTSTIPYNPTYKDTPTRTRTQHPAKFPSLLFLHTSFINTHKHLSLYA